MNVFGIFGFRIQKCLTNVVHFHKFSHLHVIIHSQVHKFSGLEEYINRWLKFMA